MVIYAQVYGFENEVERFTRVMSALDDHYLKKAEEKSEAMKKSKPSKPTPPPRRPRK